jgi:hypothetical protein
MALAQTPGFGPPEKPCGNERMTSRSLKPSSRMRSLPIVGIDDEVVPALIRVPVTVTLSSSVGSSSILVLSACGAARLVSRHDLGGCAVERQQ